jgi:hypothetical protein
MNLTLFVCRYCTSDHYPFFFFYCIGPPCASNPCINGATCISDSTNYTCLCYSTLQPGYHEDVYDVSGDYTWPIPLGVTSVYVRIWGSGGAGTLNGTGGDAAYISRNLSISGNASHSIRIRVGAIAEGPYPDNGSGSAGGCVGLPPFICTESGSGGVAYDGSSYSGVGGGAGGGFSGITNETGAWILIAGSGGGAGGGRNASGGNAGCLLGQMGGGYGSLYNGGNGYFGGQGGSQLGGGLGGTCDFCNPGADGVIGDVDTGYSGGWGGDGDAQSTPSLGGGGGGAGYYGGGGGAGSIFPDYVVSAGGGGGGSSLFRGGNCISSIRQTTVGDNGGYCGHAGQGGTIGFRPYGNGYPGRITFTYVINNCLSNPCQQGGTCVNGVNSFICICPTGYTGSICQNNIHTCSSSPCQHGASCLDGINSYYCSCVAGYSGTLCQTDVNECGSSPCENDGTCIDDIDSYSCQCTSSIYTGTNCDIVCNNHGEVTESGTCACENYFVGLNCSVPCSGSGYMNSDSDCICYETNHGMNCEFIDACLDMPCENGGTCVMDLNSYTCSCPLPYTGHNCVNLIVESGDDCSGVGTVVDGVCVCPSHYSGDHCEVICSDHGHLGTNPDLCICDIFYSGIDCNDECSGNGFVFNNTCVCETGIDGNFCEQICNGYGELVNGKCKCPDDRLGLVCEYSILESPDCQQGQSDPVE